jgi:hypothetical protein
MSRTTYEQYVEAKINTGATPEDTVASLRAEFPAITLAEAFQAIRSMTAIVSETSWQPQANTPGKIDEVLLDALGSNLGTELGGESVVADAAYQAWLLCQAFPDENALAIAGEIKDSYPSLTLTEMAQVLKHNSLHPVFPQMTLTEMATTLVNPALGSATFSDVAVALHSPGVYPQLEADEMGQALKTPSVFPNISKEDMSTAFKVAGYPQAEIDSAVAQLFPTSVVGYRKIGPVGITADSFCDPFDDTEAALNLNQPLIKLSIGSGNVVDSIQAFYVSDTIPLTGRHGGSGGDSIANIILGDDYITKVDGYYGDYEGGHYILQLTFQTKSGKIHGPYGDMVNTDPDRTPFSLEANDNERVIALFGTAGIYPGTAGFYLCSIGITVVKI